MNRYRPTTLRLASRHCPRAVDYYDSGRPYPREHFAVGNAAHAVLEALGHAVKAKVGVLTEAEKQQVADRVAKGLMTTGRTFDGVAEPPMAADPVNEGRDLALRYAMTGALSPTARYELGVGFDRDWWAVEYDSKDARFRLVYDVFDVIEDTDEESGATGLLVRDYKTAWSTDANELETQQMKAQAVCAWQLVATPPAWLLDQSISFIRQEVVNLRTGATFSRTLWIDGMGSGGSEVDGVALLLQWKKDLTAAMDALDAMQTRHIGACDGSCYGCGAAPGKECTPTSRPARPGTGCAGCPWVLVCEPAQTFLAGGQSCGPEGAARALAAAKARYEAAEDLARLVLDDVDHVDVDGYRVGTAVVRRREPKPDAGQQLLQAWTQRGGDAAGLLKAATPGLSQIEAAAKVLYPIDRAAGREEASAQKLAREELVAKLTQPKISKKWGFTKLEAGDADE